MLADFKDSELLEGLGWEKGTAQTHKAREGSGLSEEERKVVF